MLRHQVEDMCQARHMYELFLLKGRMQVGAIVTHDFPGKKYGMGLTTSGPDPAELTQSLLQCEACTIGILAEARCGIIFSVPLQSLWNVGRALVVQKTTHPKRALRRGR